MGYTLKAIREALCAVGVSVIRPVPQVSASLQINSAISIAGYVQTAFKPSLVPASGSYFSNADPAIDGGETILLGPGVFALRQPDKRPSNQGQWGLQLKLRGDGLDYGLYAVRFHSKLPQAVPLIGLTPAGPAPIGYYLGYHKGVKAFGFSVSKTIDEFNLALEASTRRNQDLASSQSADVSSFTPAPATNVTDSLRDAWRMTLSYTHYFGRAKPFQDPTNANAYRHGAQDGQGHQGIGAHGQGPGLRPQGRAALHPAVHDLPQAQRHRRQRPAAV